MSKNNVKIMDVAVDLAKKKFKAKPFSFYELVDYIIEKGYNFDTSDLYISMIEDVRFLSIGKQKWKLREMFKFEEAEKIKMSMFGDKESFEDEDYEKLENMTDDERELANTKNLEDEFDENIDIEIDDDNELFLGEKDNIDELGEDDEN